MVGRLLIIDAVAAVIAFGAWYFLFAAYNRRQGTEALRWVQSACAGKGRVLDSDGLTVPVFMPGCNSLPAVSKTRT